MTSNNTHRVLKMKRDVFKEKTPSIASRPERKLSHRFL